MNQYFTRRKLNVDCQHSYTEVQSKTLYIHERLVGLGV